MFGGVFWFAMRGKPDDGSPPMNLVCKVTPNARKSACAGWIADERGRRVLLIKLAAPPVEGRANEELVRFLADLLDCPRGQIELLRGGTGRVKSLSIPESAASKLPPGQ
jgi:uncharacterized protein (TIGR00251 family)